MHSKFLFAGIILAQISAGGGASTSKSSSSLTSGTTPISGGATTQVCFNDAGTLSCGSTKLLFNKTTGNVTNTALSLTQGGIGQFATGRVSFASTFVDITVNDITLSCIGTTCNLVIATLPAKSVVKNAYVRVITPATATGLATMTIACGRTAASFIDYIVASDGMAAADTVYGDASGERGTNLTGYDLPSVTTTTNITCHLVSSGANLQNFSAGEFYIYLETTVLQ